MSSQRGLAEADDVELSSRPISDPLTIEKDGTPGEQRTNTIASRHFDLSHVASNAISASPPSLVRDRTRYEVVVEHGRGGLGRVLRAHDREIGRDVAVKELLKRSPRAEERFLREALITARLEHPGIVPVHETGRWSDGTPFYAMKLVSGRPMSALLAEAKSTTDRLALLPHVVAVADALAYAHSKRIIHRDIKPSNVIIGEFGETVVVDWGLAKQVADPDQHDVADGPYRNAAEPTELTVAGSILGTPGYMSPEQARGEPVDETCDVYSIGALLFALGTGRPPILHSTAEGLRRGLRHLDADFASIAVKALSASPVDRYRDAGELAADLRAYVAGVRIGARRYSLRALLGHWLRTHKQIALVAAVFALVLVVMGAIAFREVVAQRDRAKDALGRTEIERDKARMAEARVFLSVDPTTAHELVANPRSAEAALLSARSRGLGVAERSIKVPDHRILDAAPTPELSYVAVTTAGRALHLVDLVAGDSIEISRGLPEPQVLANNAGATWYFPTVRAHRSRLNSFRLGDPGAVTSSSPGIENPPVQLAAEGGDIWALYPDGRLVARAGDPPEVIHSDVRAFVPFDDGLLVCLRSEKLIAVHENAERSMGRCSAATTRFSMVSSYMGRAFAVPASATNVHVYSGGVQREFPIPTSETSRLAISDIGLLGAIDANGRTWYRVPGEDTLRPGERSEGAPSAVTVAGNLVIWGFADGSLTALDTESGESWRLFGHNAPVVHLFANPVSRRVVSIGGSEVRSWILQPQPWRRIGRLGCIPFNAAVDAGARRIAFDCGDGTVSVLNRSSGKITRLHKHEVLGFGVVFVQDRVCSSGWDGRVLCTPADGGDTVTVATHAQPVRWLAAAKNTGAFAYAVADGGVWYVPSNGLPRLSHTHRGEPYRIAFDDSGRFLASGDHDGNLMVAAIEEDGASKVIAEASAHKGLVASVGWTAGTLVTAGDDGVFAEWTHLLTRTSESKQNTFLKLLTVSEQTRVAALGLNSVWMRDKTGHEQSIDIGTQVTALDSLQGGIIAAGTREGELLVVDSSGPAPRFASMPLDDNKVGAVRFLDPSTLLVTTGSGGIYEVSLKRLTFETPEGLVQ